jgi:hypothetical protein
MRYSRGLGAAGAVVGHEKLEERERSCNFREKEIFFGLNRVNSGQPELTYLIHNPIIIPD